jgi:hypothetical protein
MREAVVDHECLYEGEDLEEDVINFKLCVVL